MPVNLNALIRYKTLDACFKNTMVKTDMLYLIKRCSASIYEATGNTSGVSERTIRNDIRIMRSDILGFNAPIIVNEGIYKYSDPKFSIFETTIQHKDLLLDIQKLLLEEYDNIKDDNVSYLLRDLGRITGLISYKQLSDEQKKRFEKIGMFFKKKSMPTDPILLDKTRYSGDLQMYKFNKEISAKKFSLKKKNVEIFKWEFILRIF